MSNGFLVDTNVLSATAPARRSARDGGNQAARAWIGAEASRLFLPVIAIGEIAIGIGEREAGGASRQATELAAWLSTLLATYPGRILGFDVEAALHARRLARQARASGIVAGFADLGVAAIAAAHGLVVATRNVKHFAPMGIMTINPFGG